MGFEDEAEQSLPRPCGQTNSRSKRTCERVFGNARVLVFKRWSVALSASCVPVPHLIRRTNSALSAI